MKKVEFSKCPLCNGPLTWEDIELMPGTYARAQVCGKCREEYLTLEENERARRAYYSKAFMSGNSLAVRIPKNLADEASLKEGTEFKISIKDGKIIIEAVI